MPKVSVIVPVYNTEAYLNKCVDSIIAQTYSNFELILVDDGSGDNSLKICEEYAQKDNRIRVFHKENGGQGSARNLGIDKAEGEYILFVDSDDYISEKTLEETVLRAEKYNADMVLFDYYDVDYLGNILYKYGTDLPREKVINIYENKYLLNFSVTVCTKLCRKAIFQNQEMRFEHRRWYEDLRLTPKLYTVCSNVVYADCEPLYYYLRREQSTMHNGNIEKTKNHRMEAVKDVTDYYKQKGLYEQFRSEMEWLFIYHGFVLPSWECIHFEGDYVSAIKELRKFAKNNVKSFYKNKYFKTLRRQDKIVFLCICLNVYPLLRLALRIKK